eukprot:1373047-Pleurochrysis_carterae.AAC.1
MAGSSLDSELCLADSRTRTRISSVVYRDFTLGCSHDAQAEARLLPAYQGSPLGALSLPWLDCDHSGRQHPQFSMPHFPAVF